jgi:hypothetical protein
MGGVRCCVATPRSRNATAIPDEAHIERDHQPRTDTHDPWRSPCSSGPVMP